jgi:hypothetical protein
LAPVAADTNQNRPDVTVAVNTLTVGGFLLTGATRNPGNIILHTSRYDEFGTTQRYCFFISEEDLSEDSVSGAEIAANHRKEVLVIVGHGDVARPHIEWSRFVNFFGGPIFSLSPLEPEFVSNLTILAHNRLPEGFIGEPDDLFEILVHSALEFVLGGRVVRYGQARRFEERPDGLALPNPHFVALYDAKAAREGYEVTVETIRQFESYVRAFDSAYSTWYRLNSFIVISGAFKQTDRTLDRRSRELLAKSGVPISFLTASTLGEIVGALKEQPLVRRSIDWARIFTCPIVRSKDAQNQIEAILRDKVIRN